MEKMKTKVSILLTFCLIITGMVLAMPKVNAATGPAPSNWAFDESSRALNDAMVAEYPSFGDANGYVTIPVANGITGTLNLSNKNITGTMNGVENFTSISQLSLHGNNITGSIPSNIGDMTQLTNLFLGNNQIGGSIPASIGDLSNLKTLSLYNNGLTGSIPASIGGLTALEELYFYNNQLTGSLPTSIGDLGNLKILNVLDNQLSGSIPSEIGDMGNLTSLYLRNNQFTGSIPASFGTLSSLTELFLANNNLSGSVPSGIGSLPLLKEFEISNNSALTGNITTSFASAPNIKFISVYGTSTSQGRPASSSLQVFLYDILNADGNGLADGVTQEDLDTLKAELVILKTQLKPTVDFSAGTTNTWVINSILPLEASIQPAENMIDATNKVDTLLTSPDFANLKPGITNDDVDEAQDAVNLLPAGPLKEELQVKIDTARNLLDAEDKVGGLIGTDGKLKPGVDKGVIDAAQAAVGKLPNGDTKTRLQAIVDKAYLLLIPSTIDPTDNTGTDTDKTLTPNALGGSKTIVKTVSTGDTTNYMLYLILLVASLSVITLVVARKKMKAK